MAEVDIFDSLTHPTPTGNWLEPRHDGSADAAALVAAMERSGIRRCLAVGMGSDVGGYRDDTYAGWVNEAVPGAVPIAYVDGPAGADRLEALGDLGYRGIKIHPRRSGLTFDDPTFVELLGAAAQVGLVVLVCTYNVGHPRHAAGGLGPGDLMAALDAAPGAQVVALHGGVTDVLEWAEWVAPRGDVLLDLSFTMARFEASSVDLDLAHLARRLDRRLCVGSDHPQFDAATLRRRFDELTAGIERDRAENIGWRNLDRWFPAPSNTDGAP